MGCLEYSTHTCNNPPPGKCGGLECKLELAEGYTTRLNPVESKSQPCSMGSWTAGTCAPGACAGACDESTVGTCTTGDPTCDTGCCDPAYKPATTITCAKAPFPDVWSALGDWSPCSEICGTGTQTQTVTCSGSCCDAALKPPVTRSCVAGCCAAELVVGTDGAGNPFTGSFPNTPDGDTASTGCPAGYIGFPADPKSLCTGTTFGPVINQCVPDVGNCPAWTTDIGMGVSGTFPATKNGDPASADCAVFDSKYQGISTAECSMGPSGVLAWQNLVQNCQPAGCAEEIFMDPNALVSCTFPASSVSPKLVTLDCSTCTPGGDASYTGVFRRVCYYGSWVVPPKFAGGCAVTAGSGCAELALRPFQGVTGTLPASPVTTEITLPCNNPESGDIVFRCNEDMTWGLVSGNCSTDCPRVDDVDVGNGRLGCWRQASSGLPGQYRYGKSGAACQSLLYCGSEGYTGAPRRTCIGGLWGPVEDPCRECENKCPVETKTGITGVSSSGLVTLDPEGRCFETRYFTCAIFGYTGDVQFFCNSAGEWVLSQSCTAPPSCTDPECGPDECGTTKTKCDGTTLTCRACECTNIPLNATRCMSDAPPSTATADIPATFVDATCSGAVMTMGCTTTTKCEYYCRCLSDYIKSSDGKSCVTSCTCPAPDPASYPDADVSTTGGSNCGDRRTVSCKTGYTGTSTPITCGSITQTWTGDGPVCTCTAKTCADLGLGSGSTSYSDGCGGTVDCGGCSLGSPYQSGTWNKSGNEACPAGSVMCALRWDEYGGEHEYFRIECCTSDASIGSPYQSGAWTKNGYDACPAGSVMCGLRWDEYGGEHSYTGIVCCTFSMPIGSPYQSGAWTKNGYDACPAGSVMCGLKRDEYGGEHDYAQIACCALDLSQCGIP